MPARGGEEEAVTRSPTISTTLSDVRPIHSGTWRRQRSASFEPTSEWVRHSGEPTEYSLHLLFDALRHELAFVDALRAWGVGAQKHTRPPER